MKFTVLISDGIDSPVAAHLMLKKKCRITAVHMDISTDKRAREKVKELLKTLEKRHRTKIKLYIIKQKPVLKEITEKCPKKLTCILC
ncbi:MAG: tRNA 4-thiouridine(8) synthase ThiI, partial [archaeon]|nr:tRNA 4-thiouridine(8) synthase ThiI [archaeon]